MTRFLTRGVAGLLVSALAGPGGVQGQVVPTRRLLAELQIGAATPDDSFAFDGVGALTIAPGGELWVYDPLNFHIKIFSPKGRHLRTIGRQGGGPGEFKTVIGWAWSPNGQAWIVDPMNARYTVLSAAGNLVATYPRPIVRYEARWLGGFDRAGRFFDQAYVPAAPPRRPQALLQVKDGRVVDSVLLPEPPGDGPRRGSMWFPLPYARQLMMAFDPAGMVWSALSDQNRVTGRTFDGRSETVMQIPASPRQLSAVERDSVNRYVARLKAELGLSSSPSTHPRVHPLVGGLYPVGHRAEIWVLRADHTPGTLFEVFDTHGRHRYRAMTSHNLRPSPAPVWIGNDIWAVAEGELGLSYVVRLGIPPN